MVERIYRDDRSLRGQRRVVTVLFTDLRDFTTLSETMAADRVAQQLNEYFPMMVEAVLRQRGVVNDFIGDAVMAIYGAPMDNPEHALDAVRTGLLMQVGLEALNAGWEARGLPTLRMGIGIHTGTVFAGNVGSAERTKYTVVGDAVNVGARVEGLNKELHTTLLITGDTYAAVKDLDTGQGARRDEGEGAATGRPRVRSPGPNGRCLRFHKEVTMGGRWWIVLAVLGVLVSAQIATPQSGDPVAILTEIKAGQGEVRVKEATETDWKLALPLLSLRVGDQIRATGPATAVLMFNGGQGTVTVSTANSPYMVQSSPRCGGGRKGRGFGRKPQPPLGWKEEGAGVRAPGDPKRETATALALPAGRQAPWGADVEWGGSDRLRYTVRVFGPQGLVWERAELPRAPLPYPANAPGLVPLVPYSWDLTARDFPPQRGQFTLLSPAEVAEAREALAALGQQGYPKNTAALLRAGFLFERELYAEAQKELQAATSADPDEPDLHVMLGQVYERLGLQGLAAQEYDEAQFLISTPPTRTP